MISIIVTRSCLSASGKKLHSGRQSSSSYRNSQWRSN